MPRSHGTVSNYRHDGCRCDECCAAKVAWRDRYKARLALQPIPDDAHGTVSTYVNRYCRCDACRVAWNAYMRAWRARRRAAATT